ncbi:hypothetical protein G6F32_017298 [Rhizopus arrhizus]|nr:hypothetical protein G6F32_017298 [Rhizopus arrhizus]
MNTIDSPSCWRNRASSANTCACTDTSNAETGSSAISTCGRMANARANPTRWRCPPENSCGKRRMASADNPTSSKSSCASANASRLGMPCTMGPWATISPTR